MTQTKEAGGRGRRQEEPQSCLLLLQSASYNSVAATFSMI